jgi:hypothetical protein
MATVAAVSAAIISAAGAQEALKSTEEEYYDFLALQGLVTRPTLNYRTLSDSEWELSEDAAQDSRNVWKANSLGTKKKLSDHISFKAYGPEWYNSYNTAEPYGQNDGALWQGKGYNSSLTAGVRLEGYGFEVTLKPQLSFSQNLDYDYITSGYDSKYAYVWSYSQNVGADAPQRFGDESFATFDWGDTEIRYTWKTITMGVGTQAVWLGPAWLNPILSSNNAATYPKFDFGIRKTALTIPGINWYAGDIEGRVWTGYLSESDYFDSDDSNNHNMLNALSLSYAPSFLPGLTLGINRVFLTKWETENLKYIGRLFTLSTSNTIEDQKASFTADWLFPQVGFEVYGEVGVDDFGRLDVNLTHTMVYTVGLKKMITINKIRNIYGEILFEWNNTEMSQDFQFTWPYNFGFHSVITQGYTNRGQWLGAGSGYGGNGQFLGFRLYYKNGFVMPFMQRCSPDNDYLYSKAVDASATDGSLNEIYFNRWKTNINYGCSLLYFFTPNLSVTGTFIYNKIYMPLYNEGDTWMRNFITQCSLKYTF